MHRRFSIIGGHVPGQPPKSTLMAYIMEQNKAQPYKQRMGRVGLRVARRIEILR